MKKIAIIGNGVSKEAIYAALSTQNLEDVVIVTPDEAIEMKDSFTFNRNNDPYIIHAPTMLSYPNQKYFICKGKHQYTKQVKDNLVSWVCQCGRKITD